jgi:dTDP-4-amino-4,6-dideoxygalactose transaminase
MGFKEGYCPEAEQYFREALSIPMYPAMSAAQVDEVTRRLRETLDV